MTVCIAVIGSWNYGNQEKPEIGQMIVTASDSMLTDSGLGLEFEGFRGKFARLTPTVMLLAAGNISVQSAVVGRLFRRGESLHSATTEEVATLYAESLMKFREQEATTLYLAPFGLTPATFLERHSQLAPELGMSIANKILGHTVEVEALVVGVENLVARIFSINSDSVVRCHDDIGFAAIGAGHSHAISYLTAHTHLLGDSIFHTEFASFSAKKRAEVAPGVGPHTDMFFITRDGVTSIDGPHRVKVDAAYSRVTKAIRQAEDKSIKRLSDEVKAIDFTRLSRK